LEQSHYEQHDRASQEEKVVQLQGRSRFCRPGVYMLYSYNVTQGRNSDADVHIIPFLSNTAYGAAGAPDDPGRAGRSA
jgi:hypothetical protein